MTAIDIVDEIDRVIYLLETIQYALGNDEVKVVDGALENVSSTLFFFAVEELKKIQENIKEL